MLKGLKVEITLNPFDIYSIGWYFQIENRLNIKKVMSKTVKASFDPFDMSNMSNN